MLETTEKDAKYDALKSKQEGSAKAKGVLRGAGYARGGGVGAVSNSDKEDDSDEDGLKKGGKVKAKKHGEKVEGGKEKSRPDKLARGGSSPKGHHTRVNINIGAGKAEKMQAMKTGVQIGAKLAAAKMSGAGGGMRPDAGASPQARPGGPGPGAMPPGGGPQGVPPTMANRGGRMNKKPLKMEAGAGGGEGRLEKKRKYGSKPKA